MTWTNRSKTSSILQNRVRIITEDGEQILAGSSENMILVSEKEVSVWTNQDKTSGTWTNQSKTAGVWTNKTK